MGCATSQAWCQRSDSWFRSAHSLLGGRIAKAWQRCHEVAGSCGSLKRFVNLSRQSHGFGFP